MLEEFLTPMGISQNALARAIGVPPRRINEIVLGKRAITADTALRLTHYFSTSEQFWMVLQASVDLEEARNRLGSRLKQLEHVAAQRLAPARYGETFACAYDASWVLGAIPAIRCTHSHVRYRRRLRRPEQAFVDRLHGGKALRVLLQFPEVDRRLHAQPALRRRVQQLGHSRCHFRRQRTLFQQQLGYR